MTRTRARLGIGAGLVALAVALAFAAITLAGGRPTPPPPSTSIEIAIKFSKFVPDSLVVPIGVPVTITLRNDDPIDHEWIVGDEQVHAVHRVGTEPLHPDRPTEVVLPAMASKTTVITFEEAGTLQFICHLPGHEAYGMTGVVTIR
jgi:uncharacterized cupredoxin-like copper-binding protein